MNEIKFNDMMEAVNHVGMSHDALRFDYLGRHMYGKTCFGIVGNPRTLGLFLVEVAMRLKTKHGYDKIRWQDLRIDGMGFDNIFYWEDVTVVDVPR